MSDTVVGSIDEALAQLQEEKASARELPHARSLSIAVTKLEEARMWTNRAFAEKAGVTEFVDVQAVHDSVPRHGAS